jgi:hypothetical protein
MSYSWGEGAGVSLFHGIARHAQTHNSRLRAALRTGKHNP